MPQPDQAAGPSLRVVLDGGQETTSRQHADRGLSGLRVKCPPEHPGQQVRTGRKVDVIARVINTEITACRIRNDLDRVHVVAGAVSHRIPVTRCTNNIADERLNAEICRHLADSSLSLSYSRFRVRGPWLAGSRRGGNGPGIAARRRSGEVKLGPGAGGSFADIA